MGLSLRLRVDLMNRTGRSFYYQIGLLVCVLSLTLQSCASVQAVLTPSVETRPTVNPIR